MYGLEIINIDDQKKRLAFTDREQMYPEFGVGERVEIDYVSENGGRVEIKGCVESTCFVHRIHAKMIGTKFIKIQRVYIKAEHFGPVETGAEEGEGC